MTYDTFPSLTSIIMGTSEQWDNTTKVVPKGVVIYEIDTKRIKVCNGASLYKDTDYVDFDSSLKPLLALLSDINTPHNAIVLDGEAMIPFEFIPTIYGSVLFVNTIEERDALGLHTESLVYVAETSSVYIVHNSAWELYSKADNFDFDIIDYITKDTAIDQIADGTTYVKTTVTHKEMLSSLSDVVRNSNGCYLIKSITPEDLTSTSNSYWLTKSPVADTGNFKYTLTKDITQFSIDFWIQTHNSYGSPSTQQTILHAKPLSKASWSTYMGSGAKGPWFNLSHNYNGAISVYASSTAATYLDLGEQKFMTPVASKVYHMRFSYDSATKTMKLDVDGKLISTKTMDPKFAKFLLIDYDHVFRGANGVGYISRIRGFSSIPDIAFLTSVSNGYRIPNNYMDDTCLYFYKFNNPDNFLLNSIPGGISATVNDSAPPNFIQQGEIAMRSLIQ